MPKKILLVLSGILAFEFLVFVIQRLEIRFLDQKEAALVKSEQTFKDPRRGFGELLALKIAKPAVLAASVKAPQIATPVPVPSPNKKTYVIAAIGDSMVETMGGSLDYLKAALKKKYPNTQFEMYNYGIGSENVMEGLRRFDNIFSRDGRNYPAITNINADVLIVGSYAYNPPFPYDRNLHWANLADLVNRAKKISKKVYILAEIAPLEKGFGWGVGGVNWPENIVVGHVAKILELLQNARGLAPTLGVGLIDVYSKTKIPGSLYGDPKYVDPHDNIHPSRYGQVFTAEEAVKTISLP